jgi:flavin reductase (DIM6/NTAB) family NADH-FMN oxidoreductase RutF
MRSYPLSKVYGLLEPGPVVLVTTATQGCKNIMTMSWHTMLEFEPPLVGCVISSGDYTFDILKETRECVIAIPTVELSEKVVKVGNTSGGNIDKFKTFSIRIEPASIVEAPLIPDCYANLECKVIDTAMVNKYNFFVLEVVKAWVNPGVKHPKTIHHLGKGSFMVAGDIIKLPSKMR